LVGFHLENEEGGDEASVRHEYKITCKGPRNELFDRIELSLECDLRNTCPGGYQRLLSQYLDGKRSDAIACIGPTGLPLSNE
jgi:hypothetical protein